MRLQVFEGRPAKQVVAEHLVRSLGWRFARNRQDHDAGDDRHVELNGDALGLCAEQMPTSKELLDDAEVQFDRPDIMLPKARAFI